MHGADLAQPHAHGGFAPTASPGADRRGRRDRLLLRRRDRDRRGGRAAAPEKAVAAATQSVIMRVLVFYVGSIFVVVALLPWNSPAMAQPYVSALERMDIPGAATS